MTFEELLEKHQPISTRAWLIDCSCGQGLLDYKEHLIEEVQTHLTVFDRKQLEEAVHAAFPDPEQ